MSRYKAPTVLKIPYHWLQYRQSLAYLLAGAMNAPRHVAHRIGPRFAFRNDEEAFVKTLMRRKQNLWIFRSNQQRFCGDFAIVDMSSPHPHHRQVWILDLKHGAPLKQGGGGAGIQFVNAAQAVEEIAHHTQIIPANTSYELLSGDRRRIQTYLGVEEI